MIGAALIAALLGAQSPRVTTAPHVLPSKPECARGAVCFSGEVYNGREFRKSINSNLDFVLKTGWTLAIEPTQPEGDCDDLASVANPPYRAHRALDIDTSYGWPAEDEVSDSPREFRFVTDCADYWVEFKRLRIVMWPYTATQQQHDQALQELGSLARGKGRLWITDCRISHADDAPDKKLGKIEWMKFTVEIKLP